MPIFIKQAFQRMIETTIFSEVTCFATFELASIVRLKLDCVSPALSLMLSLNELEHGSLMAMILVLIRSGQR